MVALQGVSVIVVEGRTRIGGRLHTVQGDIGGWVGGWIGGSAGLPPKQGFPLRQACLLCSTHNLVNLAASSYRVTINMIINLLNHAVGPDGAAAGIGVDLGGAWIHGLGSEDEGETRQCVMMM